MRFEKINFFCLFIVWWGKILTFHKQEMEQLLPVIANILQCTTVDMEMVKRAFEVSIDRRPKRQTSNPIQLNLIFSFLFFFFLLGSQKIDFCVRGDCLWARTK